MENAGAEDYNPRRSEAIDRCAGLMLKGKQK
jgi:hypothetical protein